MDVEATLRAVGTRDKRATARHPPAQGGRHRAPTVESGPHAYPCYRGREAQWRPSRLRTEALEDALPADASNSMLDLSVAQAMFIAPCEVGLKGDPAVPGQAARKPGAQLPFASEMAGSTSVSSVSMVSM